MVGQQSLKLPIVDRTHVPQPGEERLPIFETEAWKALPAHVRAAFEWTLETHAAAYHYLAGR